MILLKIGIDEKMNDQISERWIEQQLSDKRKTGHDVCIILSIMEGDIHLHLSAGDCPGSDIDGSSQEFSKNELKIIKLWMKKTDGIRISADAIASFIKEIRQIL